MILEFVGAIVIIVYGVEESHSKYRRKIFKKCGYSQSYSVLANTSCSIELSEVVMETSGLYTCLVTGGDIPFKEDSNTKTIKVAGIDCIDQDFKNSFFFVKVAPVFAPRISGVLSSYTPGDFVNLNCSTSNVRYQTQI